ncbi:MAG: hypothetical protein ACUZ77_08520 [Candidatus Brocadiales bacterium]
MPKNTTHQQHADLMEILSKATSTHELPEEMFTMDGRLSNEKAILLVMRHLEDFKTFAPDNK